MALALRDLLERIVNVFLGLAIFFLSLRILFELFTANATTPFVAWIYSVSNYLVAPFRGILPSPATQSGIVDMPALVAIVTYTVLAYLVMGIISTFTVEINNQYRTHYH
ncbi:MAG TPA: YggT family protein [Candidatus Saccharimonadales bacterium]|nr:YggT family protein [Candidatus Saccharimonadales bacterium]